MLKIGNAEKMINIGNACKIGKLKKIPRLILNGRVDFVYYVQISHLSKIKRWKCFWKLSKFSRTLRDWKEWKENDVILVYLLGKCPPTKANSNTLTCLLDPNAHIEIWHFHVSSLMLLHNDYMRIWLVGTSRTFISLIYGEQNRQRTWSSERKNLDACVN